MALVGASGESLAVGGANQDRNLDRAWKYGDTLSPLYYAFRHCLVWRGHDSSMTSADAAGRCAMLDFIRPTQTDQQHPAWPSLSPLAGQVRPSWVHFVQLPLYLPTTADDAQ